MAASIKPIDNTSVHRIHSGQVVLDLQSCLKELVENALDAGATSIEVRIKDSGTTSIEVVDNGSGISSADWAFIGLKHHTSKLPELALLHDVTTFGFRGEALSALCALSESVTVTTSTKEMEPMGVVIQLGRDGRVLDDTGKVARPRGTTITLTNLFAPLPVRRKEFERNAKKELTKALTLLTAYALVPASCTPSAPGIRLKVDSLTSGKAAKRSSMLSNDGRGDLRANVMAVWGSKALDGVTDVDLELDVAVDRMARREGAEDVNQAVKVKGLLSSAAWGQGRSSADRQYFYVNGRPAELKVIQKVVNEVYKSFNTHQVPLAILDFTVPRESVDINVSPDKRTLMLHSESNLLSALRISLEQYFAPSRSTFAIEGATQTSRALKSTQSKLALASANGPAKAVAQEVPESEVEMEDEPEASATPAPEPSRQRSSSSPIPPSRRATANAEAGPSKPRTQVITVLDEDDEDDLPQRLQSRSASRLPRSKPTPLIATPAISPASPARKRTQATIQTSTASWSPDRKGKGGSKVASGTEARKSLRERLKVYSQSQPEPTPDEDEAEDADLEEEEGGGDEEPEVIPVEDDESDEDEVMAVEPPQAMQEGEEEMEKEMEEPISEEDEPVPIEVEGEAGDEDQDHEMVAVAAPKQKANGTSKAAEELEDDIEAIDRPSSSSNSRPRRRRIESPQPEPEPIPTSSAQTSKRSRPPSSCAVNPAAASSAPPTRDNAASTSSLQAYRSEIPSTATTGEITLSFSLPRLQARYARKAKLRSSTTANGSSETYSKLSRSGVTAEAGIANRDMHSAEEALSRVISKADFGHMEVVGQFNKGFIIARLAKTAEDGTITDDLLIVDQHATDEKFNFETLQLTTQIKGQALIKPRPLELTAADELTAIENLQVLKANGFEVDVDEDKPPGRGERVKLVAMPVSKETVFDFKDLEQLLHMLSDSTHATGQMVRCSKARSMFAMRACRKSVMIGKSLTKGQMTQLLRNMGTIDQPWNCPHGRPTMRHLTNLEGRRDQSGTGRIDWSSWAEQAAN